MNIVTLIRNDVRLVLRDKTLLVFLVAPLLLLLFARYFIPYLTSVYPVIGNYYHIIVMFGSIQTAIMIGFITAFIILDEKDENVMQALSVLPVSSNKFLVSRLCFSTAFSFAGALLMVFFSGLVFPGFINGILLSLLYALSAPFISMAVASFAQNKVEGMAYFKAIDLLLILPMLGFFIPAIKWFFVFVPAAWIYLYFEGAIAGEQKVWIYITGLLYHIFVLYLLFRIFGQRVFNR